MIRYIEDLGIDISVETTARLQAILKKVFHGEISRERAVEIAKEKLRKDFAGREKVIEARIKEEKKMLGKCPKCGGQVIETKLSYACENVDCKFRIWKKESDYYSKYFEAIGFELKDTDVKNFLIKGKTLAKNLVSKNGKKYNAYIKADFLGDFPKWSLEFQKKMKK